MKSSDPSTGNFQRICAFVINPWDISFVHPSEFLVSFLFHYLIYRPDLKTSPPLSNDCKGERIQVKLYANVLHMPSCVVLPDCSGEFTDKLKKISHSHPSVSYKRFHIKDESEIGARNDWSVTEYSPLRLPGVAYITDNLKGNCSVIPIENNTFDTRFSDPAHVRIRSSKEFFYFDQSQYIYEGQVRRRV